LIFSGNIARTYTIKNTKHKQNKRKNISVEEIVITSIRNKELIEKVSNIETELAEEYFTGSIHTSCMYKDV